MLTQLSTTEEELERFFGMPPAKSDPEIPWPYSGLLFTVTVGRYRVICDMTPSCKQVELTIQADGELFYQLSSPMLDDIRVHANPTHDTMELVVSPKDSIFLRLSPSVLVTQRTWDGT